MTSALFHPGDRQPGVRTAIRETKTGAERVARALGWMSVGVGAAKLLSPNTVARAAGLSGSFVHDGLVAPVVRALGARDLGTGLAIVSGRRPGALWSRVAGDLFDLGWLAARSRRTPDSSRVATTALAVAGVATVGILCAQRLSAPRKPSYRDEPDGSVRFVHSIAINQAPEVCYAFWRSAENLPRVMPSLERVERDAARGMRWIAKGGAEWTAEITEDSPPNLITWRSTGGAIDADGSIRFLPGANGRGTFVRSVYRHRPPVGVGNWFARRAGRDPGSEMREALRRLKQILETGEVITVENQSRGPGRPTLARTVSAA